jgi:hypothetical protein
MKKILSALFIPILFLGCSDESRHAPEFKVSKKYHDYWSNGKAEINHYDLTQARYGELRKGTAELIFVKEEFLWKEQVKSDNQSEYTAPVLKLNAVRKFQTGIYPYSILTSVFQPFCEHSESGARKITFSSQEWCGHVYTQMNHVGKQWFCTLHSYFATEGDQKIALSKKTTEDELFCQIRMNPKRIKTGKTKIIPSLTYLRLLHKQFEPYDAEVSIISKNDTNQLTILYPTINREVNISYESDFPHMILGWTEKFTSNYSGSEKQLMTKAKLKKSMKIDYWNKNSVADTSYHNALIQD